MAAAKKIVVFMGMLLSLVLAAYSIPGSATYNTIYNPSACLGYHTPTKRVAAASEGIWENGKACGRSYRVTCTAATNLGVSHPCTGESVTVHIVDLCPECRGTLDLSEDAFATIADTNAGLIRINYEEV